MKLECGMKQKFDDPGRRDGKFSERSRSTGVTVIKSKSGTLLRKLFHYLRFF